MTETSQTRHQSRPPYKASEDMAGRLQLISADLINLHLVGKQAHWNTVGRNFRDLHLQLDEVVEAAREFADDLAERMRALYVTPDGRADKVAQQTSIAEFPSGEVDTHDTIDLVVTALYSVSSRMREHHDAIDEEDPTTADLLHGFLERLEQLAWMMDAENRVAESSIPRPIHE